jgi:hypothetical protein
MQQIIFLRKLRDFGEKISDTFLFLKRNWKNLFGVYAVFVVPFLMLGVILALFFASRVYALFSSNVQAMQPSDFFTPEFFLIILCLVLAGTSYNTSVYCYFRLYDEQKGIPPTLAQVGQLFFRKVIPVFLYNIVVMLLLIAVAIIPGFLLAVVPLLGVFGFMLMFLFFLVIVLHINSIYVIEDVGLGGGISRLFYLLQNSWWASIGFTVVICIIFYVFSFVIEFAFLIVFSILSVSYSGSGLHSGNANGHFVIAAVLVFGLMMLIQQIFYLIVFTGVGINYYSLAEEKDGSAIEAQIESIGDNTDKYGGIEEQY